MSSPHTIDVLAWLHEITPIATANHWQIHKIQLTQHIIRQDLPIKLIYHYEKVDDSLKAQFPLTGSLLKQFNTLMTREQFVNLPELHGLNLGNVAQPWQLKFMGKLVIFSQTPEVAIRLWWTNTLKDFELVDAKDLNDAIAASFYHWQFIDTVEIICKTPNVILTAHGSDFTESSLSESWQMTASTSFEPVPSAIGIEIQELLNEHPFVKEYWLPQLIDLAKNQIQIRHSE